MLLERLLLLFDGYVRVDQLLVLVVTHHLTLADFIRSSSVFGRLRGWIHRQSRSIDGLLSDISLVSRQEWRHSEIFYIQ